MDLDLHSKSLRRQTKYAGRIHGIWDSGRDQGWAFGTGCRWQPPQQYLYFVYGEQSDHEAMVLSDPSYEAGVLAPLQGRWGRTDGSLPAWKPIDRPVLGNWIGYP